MNKLIEEATQIQDFLEITTSDNITELIERLRDINVYLARSGKMLADAKKAQEQKTMHLFEENMEQIKGLSPSLATKYINGCLENEIFLVKWIDRINRTLVHQGENLRTQISYLKEEFKQVHYGTATRVD